MLMLKLKELITNLLINRTAKINLLLHISAFSKNSFMIHNNETDLFVEDSYWRDLSDIFDRFEYYLNNAPVSIVIKFRILQLLVQS